MIPTGWWKTILKLPTVLNTIYKKIDALQSIAPAVTDEQIRALNRVLVRLETIGSELTDKLLIPDISLNPPIVSIDTGQPATWYDNQTSLDLVSYIDLDFGTKIYRIYGGPYKQKPECIRGVNMALEIDAKCTVDIPTADFNVPNNLLMEHALYKALILLKTEGAIYAGCLGGIGRTGLFMVLMAKVSIGMAGHSDGVDLPVKFVREHYNSHAVETQEQLSYVRGFDVSTVVDLVSESQLFD